MPSEAASSEENSSSESSKIYIKDEIILALEDENNDDEKIYQKFSILFELHPPKNISWVREALCHNPLNDNIFGKVWRNLFKYREAACPTNIIKTAVIIFLNHPAKIEIGQAIIKHSNNAAI